MITLESNLATASNAEGEHTLQHSNSVSDIFPREIHTLVQRDCSTVGSGKKKWASTRKEINELWYIHNGIQIKVKETCIMNK